jgi:hypothetical protein
MLGPIRDARALFFPIRRNRQCIANGFKHIATPAADEPAVGGLSPIDQHAVVGEDDQGLGLLGLQQIQEFRGQVDGPDERSQDGAVAAGAADGGLGEGAKEGVDCQSISVCGVTVWGDGADAEEVRDSVGAGNVVGGGVLCVGHFVEEGFQEGGFDCVGEHVENQLAASEEVEPLEDVGVEV